MNLKRISIAAALALATLSVAPATMAASTTTTTTTTTTSKPTTTKPAKPTMKPAAKPADPKRFKTEAKAAKSCPADTVVWVNLKSKIFHLKGTALYGKSKSGVYMCKADAKAEKFVPTKKPEKIVTTTTTTTMTKSTTTTKGK